MFHIFVSLFDIWSGVNNIMMERSLNLSPDLLMSDCSSDSSSSSSSCHSYSPPSRSSLDSYLSSSSSSSMAFHLEDDDGKEYDDDDFDASKGGTKFPAPLSYSFKISEAEREIFKDLEKERVEEKKDDVEIAVKKTKKMNFLNIKKKKKNGSSSFDRKMKWGENGGGGFSPASRTNNERRETTFKDYIDLSRVSVLNENDEIILNSKNRNIISDDIYEPDHSLPDLKINDVCYIGSPPPPPPNCGGGSSSIDAFSSINASNASATSTADTHDTFGNSGGSSRSRVNTDTTTTAYDINDNSNSITSFSNTHSTANSISYVFRKPNSREERQAMEFLKENIPDPSVKSILFEKFKPDIFYMYPYTREILTIVKMYEEHKRNRDKYMNVMQRNSNNFIAAILRKCVIIIKGCFQIEGDIRRKNITLTALRIFHLKMCRSLKKFKRIRIPNIQLDWCIHAAILKLNAFTTVNVKEINFDTKFCNFVDSLGDKVLLSKLNNINNATFLIFKYTHLVGFNPSQMSRAVDLYKLISSNNTLEQKTPKNLALAVLCYIDPRIKPRAAKFCNLKTIQNIGTHIRNYMDCIGSYNKFFLYSARQTQKPKKSESESESESGGDRWSGGGDGGGGRQWVERRRQRERERERERRRYGLSLPSIQAKYQLLKLGLKKAVFKNIFDITCYTDIDQIIYETRRMEKYHHLLSKAFSNNPKLKALFDPVDLKFLPCRSLIPDFEETGKGRAGGGVFNKNNERMSHEDVVYHIY